MRPCASSTERRLTGPMNSMSSFSIALARDDMFEKIEVLDVLVGTLQGEADILHVDLLEELLDRLRVEDQESSNTNISLRTSSASSASFSSRYSSTLRSVARSE